MKPLVVDGANVAWVHGKSLFPSFEGIVIAINAALEQGYTVLLMLNNRYHVPWSSKIRVVGDWDGVYVIPSLSDGNSDDRVMIDYATNKRCKILSNDKFRDHLLKLSKSKRAGANRWVESNVIQFMFIQNEIIFKQGKQRERVYINHTDIRNLSSTLEEKIEPNTEYNTIKLGELLFLSLNENNISIPSKNNLLKSLSLQENVRIGKIIHLMVQSKFVQVVTDNDKIGPVIQFIPIQDLNLNEKLLELYEKYLRGILFEGWISASDLAHQINVAMFGSTKQKRTTKELFSELGFPDGISFQQVLHVILNEELLSIDFISNNEVVTYFCVKEFEQKCSDLDLNPKQILNQISKNNYSIRNIPLSILDKEFEMIICDEKKWVSGMSVNEISQRFIKLTGVSVKTVFGSIKKMLQTVNHFNDSSEEWEVVNGNIKQS